MKVYLAGGAKIGNGLQVGYCKVSQFFVLKYVATSRDLTRH